MPAYRKCSVHGQQFPSFKKNVLKRTNTLYPRAQSAALLISRACGRKALLRRMGTSSDFPGRPLSYGLNLGLGSCFKEEKKKNADKIHEKQVGTFVYSTQLEKSTCDHRLWISASEESTRDFQGATGIPTLPQATAAGVSQGREQGGPLPLTPSQ